jgi:uncharacterized membrane protein YeaQ/YmgE (transglycosylase-associated protein family)
MSFIWIIVIGLAAGIIAKYLMPQFGAGGLIILGVGGAIIAGVMQYSLNQPTGLIAPFIGAVMLLVVFAATARHQVEEIDSDEDKHEDIRKAA